MIVWYIHNGKAQCFEADMEDYEEYTTDYEIEEQLTEDLLLHLGGDLEFMDLNGSIEKIRKELKLRD